MLSDDLRNLSGVLDRRQQRFEGQLFFDQAQADAIRQLVAVMVDQAQALEGRAVPMAARTVPDGVADLTVVRAQRLGELAQ